jgi:hypothetical protein
LLDVKDAAGSDVGVAEERLVLEPPADVVDHLEPELLESDLLRSRTRRS